MLFGASLSIPEVRKFLEKQNLRTTFTRYEEAQFGHTSSCPMVGGRSEPSICKATSSASRMTRFIDLRLKQSSKPRSGPQSAGGFLEGSRKVTFLPRTISGT